MFLAVDIDTVPRDRSLDFVLVNKANVFFCEMFIDHIWSLILSYELNYPSFKAILRSSPPPPFELQFWLGKKHGFQRFSRIIVLKDFRAEI